MTRTRIARKRAPTPVESGEGPSGDLGGVPSCRLEEVPEVGLTGEPKVGKTAARPRKRREGEGAVSDSDDEEYTAPLDELLASDDSDDPMDDGGSEGHNDEVTGVLRG
ncbi:hypothetical protein MRB53_016342 [Persea americana]|uniref:Uncharacterized protein n=1 Tax=Persea americana TaxID=3435 RepID=A0ACC2M2J4_PERAE|nr:hypothetical protein MRB53_016342 [Persea americana]